MRFPNDGPPPPENGQQVIERMERIIPSRDRVRVLRQWRAAVVTDGSGRVLEVVEQQDERASGPWDSNGTDR